MASWDDFPTEPPTSSSRPATDASADPWAAFPKEAPQGAITVTDPKKEEYPSWGRSVAEMAISPIGFLATNPIPRDFARVAGNAASIGMLDRARAFGNSVLGGKTYDEQLQTELGKTAEAEKNLGPFGRGGANVVGGGALAALTGGAISSIAPWLRSASMPLWKQAVVGAGEGFGLGAAHGAGTTYSGIPADYIGNAAMGGVFGAGVGAAAPIAGAGMGALDRYLTGFRRPNGDVLPPAMVKAAEADPAAAMKVASPSQPGAMLPDAGPAMQGVAQGAALPNDTVSTGRTALVDALKERARDAGKRITSAVNETFGKAPTPEYVQEGIKANIDKLGPKYEEALTKAKAVDTQGIADHIATKVVTERGQAQSMLKQVRSMLDVEGSPGNLDPDPRVLQKVRSEVREMRDHPETGGKAKDALNEVYDKITTELQSKVPGIRELDHQRLELQKQLDAAQVGSEGGKFFRTDQETVQRPEILRDKMQGRPPGIGHNSGEEYTSAPKGDNIGPSAEGFRLQQSARAELERIVGTTGRDLSKLENVIAKPEDFNHQKLAIMFGEDRAAKLMQVLERERMFANTNRDVVEGSQTASRQAAKESIDGKPIPITATATGIGSQVLQGAYNKLFKTAADKSRDRIAQYMATRDPVEIGTLVNDLLAARAARDARAGITRSIVERGVMGTGTAAVGINRQK